MSAPAVAPDERVLAADLAGVRFQDGADRGFWRLVSLDWPFALIAVSAAPRPGSPVEFLLRIECSGYPAQAPTGCPCDAETNAVLASDRRPKGERVGQVFRPDWKEGRALYAPWDRTGLAEHPGWAAAHPFWAWHPGRDISFFLTNVHELLNDDDYTGI
jgi:hypothetical protein